MSFGYNEDLLQFIWEHQLYAQQNLVTQQGQEVSILKQGFLNTNSGPDFEHAQVKIGNTIHHGSIEIHVDSREWHQHKHDQDPHYNTVILHVCYSYNNEATRHDGSAIPTLVIGQRISQNSLEKYRLLLDSKAFIPCQNQLALLNQFDKTNWLERMIIERLESRFELFSAYLNRSQNNWNQAFYIAIVRAFGLPVNTESFEELAQKLPFEMVQKHQASLFQLEALFFGVAGLLIPQHNDTYYTGLQSEYTFLKAKYKLVEINASLKMGRIRPMNLPHIKLAQLAAFVHQVPDFISIVLELPDVKTVKQLLDFDLSNYWQTHYTFTNQSSKRHKKISVGFINHLFINAIVPFVFFYQTQKTENNTDKALEYLESIPTEKNIIVSQWKNVGLSASNAANSQALLHLYKNYCLPKKCLQCNLGKKILLQKSETD
jgi:hypothetical protein